MPVHYTIDTEQKRICTQCTGFITFEEVCEHFQVLRLDPEFGERLDVLLDLSDCTSVSTAEQLREVAARIDSLSGGWRLGFCAIIVKEEELFGMTRIFEVYTQKIFTGTAIFRSAEEGERWLSSLQEMKNASL